MILQSLVGYYERCQGELAPPGWIRKKVDFVVDLTPDGAIGQVNDLREGKDRERVGRPMLLPNIGKQAQRHTSSGKDANLLWDNAWFLFGLTSNGAATTQAFLETLDKYFPDGNGADDPGIIAIKNLFRSMVLDPEKAAPILKELPKKDGVALSAIIAFRLAGDIEYLHERNVVRSQVNDNAISSQDGEEGRKGICLVTGEFGGLSRNHTVIKGILGGQSSGCCIVSFNKDAFCSYGNKNDASYNAPVSELAMFKYTTALNDLLSDKRHRLQIGDAAAVFWSEKPSRLESDFVDIFSDPPKDNPHAGTDAVNALFNAPKTGAWLKEESGVRFYVLGLSPNAARIAVRFWIIDTVGGLAGHISRHFEDIQIIHGPNEPDVLSLSALLRQTAALGKLDNIPPNLAGETMRSILDGGRYPKTLLSTLIRRIRADGEIPYPRAAFIKACLNRMARNNYDDSEKENLKMSLNLENQNQGYRLGRLFAALEKTQEEAQGNLNRTIRERYYAAASSTPAVVFGTLLRLKNHHLAKIENKGRQVKLEKLFAEIMGGISDMPSTLPMEDQGRFAIGYYHQRQDFYTKKEDKNEE